MLYEGYAMIKAVIVDMDGTLLDDKNAVSEYTVSVIKEFQKQGGVFVINTGRSYVSASKIVKGAGISCDYICLSGAAVYNAEGECIFCDALTSEEIQAIRKLEEKNAVYVNYLTAEGVFSECSKEIAKQYYFKEASLLAQKANKEFHEEEAAQKYQWILDMVHYNTDMNQKIKEELPIYKAVVMGMNEPDTEKVETEIQNHATLLIAATSPLSQEINAMRVDKGRAILEYISKNGILPEEVMVIGDSENDIPMFQPSFGKKIAMANAIEELKQRSTDVTASNTEDGVAYAIETWGLK